MAKTSLLACCLLALLAYPAGAQTPAEPKPADPAPAAAPAKPAAGGPRVALETTKGKIVIELNSAKAPITVANFLKYVDAGYYNGTIFHRVIDNFMIQAGGFNFAGDAKTPNPPIKNEADNGLTNNRGTIAMARTSVPDSASAQFFINTVDNLSLNHKGKTQSGWGYAVFGKVVEGMDVVDAIGRSKTSKQNGVPDMPVEKIIIKKASRVP
jgi:peptidyl-prolyl cis-trans isomerase B (cyclophilin B)